MSRKPLPPVKIVAKSSKGDILGKWVEVERIDGLRFTIYPFSRSYNKVKGKKVGSKVRL